LTPLFLLPSAAAYVNGRIEGELRMAVAHAQLHRRRAVLVRRVQRAFIGHLLSHGTSTIDPIRDSVPLPAGIDARLVGAAVRALAEEGVIGSVGIEKSQRAVAHARKVERWALQDVDLALTWLECNVTLDDDDKTTTLFD